MEVSLCEKCSSCPRVMTVKGGMEIGEEGNSVRLKPEEWNLLVDKIRKGELNKL